MLVASFWRWQEPLRAQEAVPGPTPEAGMATVAVVADPVTTAPTPAPTVAKQGLVLVLPVRNDIESGLSFFIQRMIRYAEQRKAVAIVFEINSPGGLVSAAEEISAAIKGTRILTIAYVQEEALSAAALIAISCEKIVMRPGSSMGAATPISLAGAGVKAAEAKFVSAFRATFEKTAEFRGRSKEMAAAMVDKDHDTIGSLSKRGQILTFTTETAYESGYCDAIVNNLDQVLEKFKLTAAPLERAEPTWGENIARWLTNPNISVLLFSAGVWIIIIDVVFLGASTGLLLVGVAMLALFFGGHMFAYLAGWEAIILFAVGLTLLAIEIFMIPGFGLTGVCGIIATALGLVLTFGGVELAVWAILKFLALSTLATILTYHIAPRTRLFDHLILKEELSTEAGFVAAPPPATPALLGIEGFALTPLHPAGYARLGAARVEVVSEGEFIEKNDRVVVIEVAADKIVVRKLS